jgi:CheY-like chemotaxis protein
VSTAEDIFGLGILPSAILLVEDEPVLRSSIARGLGRLTNVEVMAAASVAEAVALLDSRAPSLLISDIDLPGQSGLELVSELRRRGINIPTIFVTAYLKSYRKFIPEHSNVLVLEKPIPINELRNHAKELLGPAGDAMRAPFNLIDYVQLACLGRRSVRIAIEYGDEAGQVIVNEGELWSAVDHQGSGPGAFARLAFVGNAMVSCFAMVGEPGVQNITTRWEQMILDSARIFDESKRDGREAEPAKESPDPRATAARLPARRATPLPKPAAGPTPSTSPSAVASHESSSDLPVARPRPPSGGPHSSRPAASSSAPSRLPSTFEGLRALGADALLNHQLGAAARAFFAAERLRPGDPLVLANLRRLKELGFGEGEEDDK